MRRFPFTDVRFAFAVALALHIGVVFLIGPYRHPSGLESIALATILHEGKGFSSPPKSEVEHFAPEAVEAARRRAAQGGPVAYALLHPTSRVSPGYPYVLFWFWKFFGRTHGTFLLIALAQALLVSSVVFPVRRLGERWFGAAAGTVAMWMACFMPLYAHYATQYSPMAVYIALHPWLVWAWIRLDDRLTVTRSVAVGAATGAAALFQPLVLALFGCLGMVRLGRLLMQRKWQRATVLLCVPLALVAVLLPWTVRNYRVHGRLVPVRYSAMPFWIGNNPRAVGVEDSGGGRSMYVAYPPRCVAIGTEVTEAEYQDALNREAWDYIRDDPGAFVRRTIRKIAWYWTAVPLRYKQGEGLSSNRLYRGLHAAYWLAFLVLAVGARLAGGRYPAEYRLVLGIYVLVCSAVYGLLHIANARMRAEIEFVLIPAVAWALVLAFDTLKRSIRAHAEKEATT